MNLAFVKYPVRLEHHLQSTAIVVNHSQSTNDYYDSIILERLWLLVVVVIQWAATGQSICK